MPELDDAAQGQGPGGTTGAKAPRNVPEKKPIVPINFCKKDDLLSG